ALIDALDFNRVGVDGDDLMPHLRQTGRCYGADISDPENANFHTILLVEFTLHRSSKIILNFPHERAFLGKVPHCTRESQVTKIQIFQRFGVSGLFMLLFLGVAAGMALAAVSQSRAEAAPPSFERVVKGEWMPLYEEVY